VSGFLVILVLLGLIWLFVILPVRRRQRAQTASHEAMQDSLAVGDEIITAGGMYAVVRAIDEDRLEIEIAPSVIATLDRRAVAAVAEDIEDDQDDEEGDDDALDDAGGEAANEGETEAGEKPVAGSEATEPETEEKPR
jgi:preprotein translocase subunit YajC